MERKTVADNSPSTPGNRISVDIVDYWWILRRRSFVVLGVAAVVFAVAFIFTKPAAPVYESSCLMRITSRSPVATIDGARVHWYGTRESDFGTELQLIVHDELLLNAAIKRIQQAVVSDSGLYPENVVQHVRSLTFQDFKSSVNAVKQQQADLIAISVHGPYAQYSQLATNTLARTYRENFAMSQTRDALETKQFIESQLNEIKASLAKNSTKMEESSRRISARGSMTVYQEELARLKIELSRAGERYTVDHPRIRKLNDQVAIITSELESYPRDQLSFDELDNNQSILQSMIKTLQELLIKADIEYKQKEAKALDDIQIVEEAGPGYNLTRSNRAINLVIAAVFALLMGSVSAFVWEGLDTSIGKIEDVERLTNRSVIAHIPILGPRQKKPFFTFRRKKDMPRSLGDKLLYHFDHKSVACEAYRTLRTNIQFAIMDSAENKILALTSSSPLEGKTLTSTNLALAISQTGKSVLLMEADLRRPQIAGLFNIDPKPGLTDLLIGSSTPERAIRTATDILVDSADWDKLVGEQSIDNLNVLPAGTNAPNPTELVASSAFKNLLETLRERYDCIIIDTPPVLPVADASLIAAMANGTILIYQSNKTSRHLLNRALQTLSKNQANIIGIVINQLSYDVTMPKSYYHKYGYGYGY